MATSEEWGLFNLSGERMPAKLIDGRYGQCWALCDEEGAFTGEFVSHISAITYDPWNGVEVNPDKATKKRIAKMASLGYQEKLETVEMVLVTDRRWGKDGKLSQLDYECRVDGGYPKGLRRAD